MLWKNNHIGLALGGGGARGLAHIGVLRVFDEMAMPIHVIVGTSAGALIGAVYANGTGPDEMQEIVDAYLNSSEFQNSAIKAIADAQEHNNHNFTQKVQGYLKNRFLLAQLMFRPGVLSTGDFQSMIDHFIPDVLIEDMPLRFRAVATDLIKGEQIVFSKGSLRQAVMASCAVPGAVEPLREGDRLLSDGGICCLVPSTVARKEGARIVVAVAVDRDICTEAEFHSARDIYTRAGDIMSHYLEHHDLMDADIVIRPNVGDLHWSDFSHAQDLIREGEKAARDNLVNIRTIAPGNKRWFSLRHILKPAR